MKSFSLSLLLAASLIVNTQSVLSNQEAEHIEERFLGTGGGTQGLMILRDDSKIDYIVDEAHRSSKCKEVTEKSGQNTVPVDYLKGMAHSLVRSLCGRQSANSLELPGVDGAQQSKTVKGLLMAAPNTYSDKDVLGLGHYNPDKVEVGNPKSSGHVGPNNAAYTYAIIAALTMQESDADITEGQDESKGDEKKTSTEEETGPLQVSPNSQALFKAKVNDNAAYAELLKSYVIGIQSAGDDEARLEEVCRVSKYTGGGSKNGKKPINPSEVLQKAKAALQSVDPNAEKLSDEQFIALNKSCPAFAIEYGALIARVHSGHNGPIDRGEVKPSKGCQEMFNEIAEMSSDPHVCKVEGLSSTAY